LDAISLVFDGCLFLRVWDVGPAVNKDVFARWFAVKFEGNVPLCVDGDCDIQKAYFPTVRKGLWVLDFEFNGGVGVIHFVIHFSGRCGVGDERVNVVDVSAKYVALLQGVEGTTFNDIHEYDGGRPGNVAPHWEA